MSPCWKRDDEQFTQFDSAVVNCTLRYENDQYIFVTMEEIARHFTGPGHSQVWVWGPSKAPNENVALKPS